jgi:hypothetical protein
MRSHQFDHDAVLPFPLFFADHAVVEAGSLAKEKFAPLLEEMWTQLQLSKVLSGAGVPKLSHPFIKKSIVLAIEAAIKAAVVRRGSQLLRCENLFAFAMRMAMLSQVASDISASAELSLEKEFERAGKTVQLLQNVLSSGPLQSPSNRLGLGQMQSSDVAAFQIAMQS